MNSILHTKQDNYTTEPIKAPVYKYTDACVHSLFYFILFTVHKRRQGFHQDFQEWFKILAKWQRE